MTYTNHNVKDIAASGTVKAGHGVIVAVYVTKAGASGDKLVFHNGVDASGAVEFTVYGEGIQHVQDVFRRFENGIYVVATGTTAKYIIVYK
jgi:TRAP-type mannitol/chloroaromatic compound transport system substrate-binding protein